MSHQTHQPGHTGADPHCRLSKIDGDVLVKDKGGEKFASLLDFSAVLIRSHAILLLMKDFKFNKRLFDWLRNLRSDKCFHLQSCSSSSNSRQNKLTEQTARLSRICLFSRLTHNLNSPYIHCSLSTYPFLVQSACLIINWLISSFINHLFINHGLVFLEEAVQFEKTLTSHFILIMLLLLINA